jgi:hypothetical protein
MRAAVNRRIGMSCPQAVSVGWRETEAATPHGDRLGAVGKTRNLDRDFGRAHRVMTLRFIASIEDPEVAHARLSLVLLRLPAVICRLQRRLRERDNEVLK